MHELGMQVFAKKLACSEDFDRSGSSPRSEHKDAALPASGKLNLAVPNI
jgi:hypothetical protein